MGRQVSVVAASARSSSATARSSWSRWPHRTSRRSARRCSASLLDEPLGPVAGGRQPADDGALEGDRPGDALGHVGAGLGLGAEDGQPLGEPAAARPLGLEQRAERQQIVGQCLDRGEALASHLEARQRPRELAAGRDPARDEIAECPQLVLLGRRDQRDQRGAATRPERHRPPGAEVGPRPRERAEGVGAALEQAQGGEDAAEAMAGDQDRRPVGARLGGASARRARSARDCARHQLPCAPQTASTGASGSVSPRTSERPSPIGSSFVLGSSPIPSRGAISVLTQRPSYSACSSSS